MIDAPEIDLEKLYVDHQGNKLIPFERRPTGKYYCCIIEPAIKLIPIVQNSGHCFREAHKITTAFLLCLVEYFRSNTCDQREGLEGALQKTL